MSGAALGLILGGVLLNALGQLLLKSGTNAVGHFEFSGGNLLPVGMKLATQPYIVTGVVCYFVSLVVWLMALSRVEVSIAYPMLSIGYVINAVAAWYLFGEAVTPMRMLGIGIIVVGVYVVARS